jgi:hypothetical protein
MLRITLALAIIATALVTIRNLRPPAPDADSRWLVLREFRDGARDDGTTVTPAPAESACVRYWSAEPYHPPCDEFGPPKLVWLEP